MFAVSIIGSDLSLKPMRANHWASCNGRPYSRRMQRRLPCLRFQHARANRPAAAARSCGTIPPPSRCRRYKDNQLAFIRPQRSDNPTYNTAAMSATAPPQQIPKFKFYQYDPSAEAAIIFIALFGLLTLLHSWQMLRTRAWYLIPFVVGGICTSYRFRCPRCTR